MLNKTRASQMNTRSSKPCATGSRSQRRASQAQAGSTKNFKGVSPIDTELPIANQSISVREISRRRSVGSGRTSNTTRSSSGINNK